MTIPAFSFEAKKYALRQAKDGVIVSFVLHPDDVVPELLSAPIGEHYVVALAPYETAAEQAEQQPGAPPPEPEKVKERRPFHTLPRSQQAAILINDASFQWWVGSNRNAAETDQMIKAHMGIASKRDLDQDIYAQKWDRMVEEFRASSGRVTWERPA